ncbi:HIT family protein [Campylobacterota bacterium]|nr:HIT family protein [Campylobacterota bacterium]
MICDGKLIYIEWHEAEIPWIKIFTKTPRKELTDASDEERTAIFHAITVCERTMLEYYKPEKINIASFGNYLPRLHIHIMVRFKDDSYFPESAWGVKQRESRLQLPSRRGFEDLLIAAMRCG